MLHLYIDGASAGNPGPSGVGLFIKKGKMRRHIAIPIEPTNNHTAEFIALAYGIQEIQSFQPSILFIYSDSKAVVEGVEKRYAKNKVHADILHDVFSFLDTIDHFFIQWIPTKENRAADQLAKEAIHLTEKQVR